MKFWGKHQVISRSLE